jgi:hypothetical protein
MQWTAKAILTFLFLACAVPASAQCGGGCGGGGGGGMVTPPQVVMPPPIIIPGAPPGIGAAVQDAIRDRMQPDIPSIGPMNPEDSARLDADNAAAEEAHRDRVNADVEFWQDWLDAGNTTKVLVGWANNIVGGIALGACATGVGCIPVVIYGGGKVVEVLAVSHAEASQGTDFVGRVINGSARPENRWRRTRINGLGTLASEVIGLPLGPLAKFPRATAGANSALQDTMGNTANDAYESLRDGYTEHRAEMARQHAVREQERADRAYLEALGINTSGFPIPAHAVR